MTIRIVEDTIRNFNITPNDVEDGKAYIDENGTIFIGCLISAVDPDGNPHTIVAHSLDGEDLIGENQDIFLAAITIEVRIV